MTVDLENWVQKRGVWVLVVAIVLSGLFFMCQLISQVAAAKMVQLGPLTLPGGTLVFAVTFTLRDAIQRLLGKRISQAIIIVAAGLNILMVLYLSAVAALPYPVWWTNQAAFVAVVGIVPRIVAASILAMLISELVDTEIYSIWVSRFTSRFLWSRVLVSNAVSCPLDSLVFQLVAFGGIFTWPEMFAAVWGQAVFKYLVTIVSVPLIYITPKVARPITGEDV